MLRALWNDEQGVVIAAELVLILTVLVLGIIVGLSELQNAVVQELNDVAEAIGSLNQTFYFSGFTSSTGHHLKAKMAGSSFHDHVDLCDRNECQIACTFPVPEAPGH